LGNAFTVIYFYLFIFGFIKHRKKMQSRLFFIVLFFPIVTLFLTSWFRTCYIDRYFFPLLPFYIIGIAMFFIGIDNQITSTAVFIMIIMTSFGLKNYYSNYLPYEWAEHVGVIEKQDIRKIPQVIEANYKNGDSVMHTFKGTVFPLKLYAQKSAVESGLSDEINRGKVIFIPAASRSDMIVLVDFKGSHPVHYLDNDYKIADELNKHARIWLIFSSANLKDKNKSEYRVLEKLKENFSEQKIEEFQGGSLYLLVKKSGDSARF